MGSPIQSPNFALDEDLWFGEDDDAEAESKAAASLAAVGARIVGAKPFPVAARRLDELTRNANTRIEQVVTVLESDPALSARLLRLVNSAGYGLKVRCTSVRHAAVLVGTRRLNQVATTAAILDLFDGTNGHAMELLEHAAVVGSMCRYLAVHVGLPHDELFTCGFLHDIGKLMLLDAERDRYAELLAEFGNAPDQMHLAERRLFGFDHAVLGAHVLAAWNIPEPVPRVIAWHHAPARALQDTVVAGMVQTLRLADLLAYVLPLHDSKLGMEIVGGSEAARYLEISEAQLSAMWDDLIALRERSRARTNGEPELDVIVPKGDLPDSLVPRSLAPSIRARASRGAASRPLHEVPAHFPCAVCAKPSYGNTCQACGGQVCPQHLVPGAEWCTACTREFTRFRKTEELNTFAKLGIATLVGATLAVAVVGVARTPGADVRNWLLAPAFVLALWAVVLPVAYRLWHKLRFLQTRRGAVLPAPLPVARATNVAIASMAPREGRPTEAAPADDGEPERSSRRAVAARDSLDPEVLMRPLSDGPLSSAPLSIPPQAMSAALASVAPRSSNPASSGSMRSEAPSSVPTMPSIPVPPPITPVPSRSPSITAESLPASRLPSDLRALGVPSLPPNLRSVVPSMPADVRSVVPSMPADVRSVVPSMPADVMSVAPSIAAAAPEAAPPSIENAVPASAVNSVAPAATLSATPSAPVAASMAPTLEASMAPAPIASAAPAPTPVTSAAPSLSPVTSLAPPPVTSLAPSPAPAASVAPVPAASVPVASSAVPSVAPPPSAVASVAPVERGAASEAPVRHSVAPLSAEPPYFTRVVPLAINSPIVASRAVGCRAVTLNSCVQATSAPRNEAPAPAADDDLRRVVA